MAKKCDGGMMMGVSAKKSMEGGKKKRKGKGVGKKMKKDRM